MSHFVRRRFTDDFKSQAVTFSGELGRTEAARPLDMSVKTLNHGVGLAHASKPFSSLDREPVSEPHSQLTRLCAENARLRMARDILKKSDGVLRQGVHMRYAFVATHRTDYPVSIMCPVLEVSSAGFYGYMKRCATVPTDPAVGNMRRSITMERKVILRCLMVHQH